MLSVSNSTETARIGHGLNGMGTYLGAERHRNPMDGLNSKTDAPTGQTSAVNVLNSATTASMGHGDNAHTYLGAGGTRGCVDDLDGFGSHADASIGRGDVPSIEDNANTAKNAPAVIRKEVKTTKLTYGSYNAAPRRTEWLRKPNGYIERAHGCTHLWKREEMAESDSRNVRTCQKELKSQNSPVALKTDWPNDRDESALETPTYSCGKTQQSKP